MKIALHIFLFILIPGAIFAQTADFSAPAIGCMEEQLVLTNNSTGATTYEWDFCTGGFDIDPVIEDLGTVSGLSNGWGLEIINDSNEWHVFLSSTGNDKIIQIKFNTNLLGGMVETVDLGNVSNVLDSPEGLNAIKIDGIWNLFSGSLPVDYGVSRIEFPSGLDMPPTGHYLGMLEANAGSRVRNSTPRFQDGTLMLVNTDYSGRFLIVVEFEDGVASPYTSVYNSGRINELHLPVGTVFANDSIAYVPSLGNDRINKINFSDDLTAVPTLEQSYSVTGIIDPYFVALITDGTDIYGVAANGNKEATVMNFGDLSSAPSALSHVLPQLSALKFIKYQGQNVLFGIGKNNHLYRITFEQDCGASVGYSTEEHPDPVSYSSDGAKEIALTAYNSDDQADITVNTVTIANATSPSIDFTVSDNECITESNTFTSIDGGGLTYAWDFDNNGSTDSTDPAPEHTLGSTGEHIVKLTVDDGMCTNAVQKTVSIFPVPQTPTFFDSGTPYCTGADITFTNLFDESSYNGATLTYTWDYNAEGTSSDRDGSYNFDSDGTKTITLTAAIPGCSTTSADSDIELIAGPAVNFSYEDKCLGDVTEFTNLTTGDGITGQTWDFGDSNGSTELSPSHEYEAAGDYNVSLTVDNDEGCTNTLIVPFTVDDKPDADFNMGVGCEGQAVGFEDASSVSSANIESYDWDFGGLGSSTQEDPLHIFETQGNYLITLTVESTYGCTDEVSKNLNVQLAPEAAFSIDLGCLGTTTQFMDETETEAENPINIWYWDINGEVVPNTQNPTEIFDTPGEYTATLTVTPSNLCTSTISQNFTIHELPVADFTYANTCDNEFTSFSDASTSTTTSIVAYNWQFDEEGTGNSNPALFRFNQSGNYQISLTVIDEVGCEDTASEEITINPSPTANFDVDRDIGPPPLLIDFTNSSEGATSYTWYFDDNDETTSTETSPQFSYAELGDYEAKLVAHNDFGCSDTLAIPITVAEPVLDLELIQVSSEESEGKINLTLSVKNSGNVPINGFDVRIDLDNNSSIYERYQGTLLRDETISYPLNFTFSALNNNIDYVCISVLDIEDQHNDIDIVNNEGCVDFEQQLVVENTYPNPATSGTSTIRLNMILPAKAPIQIFLLDAAGDVLYQDIYQDTDQGLNSFFLDIYSYKQGMYFIKVIYDNIESTQRFVKL